MACHFYLAYNVFPQPLPSNGTKPPPLVLNQWQTPALAMGWPWEFRSTRKKYLPTREVSDLQRLWDPKWSQLYPQFIERPSGVQHLNTKEARDTAQVVPKRAPRPAQDKTVHRFEPQRKVAELKFAKGVSIVGTNSSAGLVRWCWEKCTAYMAYIPGTHLSLVSGCKKTCCNFMAFKICLDGHSGMTFHSYSGYSGYVSSNLCLRKNPHSTIKVSIQDWNQLVENLSIDWGRPWSKVGSHNITMLPKIYEY